MLIEIFEGLDVSDILGIQKYEAPIPSCLSGVVRGNFPAFFHKTDQERIQNLKKYFEKYKEYTWEVSEKCEGSSSTYYYNNGEFGVCSRNLDLKEDYNNSFWRMAAHYDIETKLENLGRNLAIQAELCGPSVQGNYYNIHSLDIFVFDVFDIDKQEYFSSIDRINLVKELGLPHVPIWINGYTIPKDFEIDNLLQLAEGKSEINNSKEREGIVFKCIENPSLSFKCISNRYLIKLND